MKIKIVIWSVASLLIIGLGAGAYSRLQRPQVITFDGGDKLTLLGVDYGMRHVSPLKKAQGGTGEQDGSLNTFTTYNKALVVWVQQEHDPKRYQNYQYFLYDQAGTASAQSSGMNSGNNNGKGKEVVAIQFSSFPRRQAKFVVRAQKYGPHGPEMAAEKFVIRNPVPGPFTATWKAESLPATKQDGDLSVTLVKLDTGADSPFSNEGDVEGNTKAVEATFQVQQNGKAVVNWKPTLVTSSDITGNTATKGVNVNQSTWNENTAVALFQSGLWLDEPAWKIRFEFAQQSGFSSNETWTVSNIPFQPGLRQDFYNSYGRRNTNTLVAETEMEGIHLRIYPATQFTDQSQRNGQIDGGFKIQSTPSLPPGMQMKVVATDNQGEEFQMNGSGSSSNGKYTVSSYQIQDIGGLTNINLTIGLHRNRFVEFFVKTK